MAALLLYTSGDHLVSGATVQFHAKASGPSGWGVRYQGIGTLLLSLFSSEVSLSTSQECERCVNL